METLLINENGGGSRRWEVVSEVVYTLRLEQLNNVLKARQEGKRGNVDASSGDSGEHEIISRAQEARQLGLRYPVQRHTRGSFGYGRGFYWECCKCVLFSVPIGSAKYIHSH